MTSSPRIGPWFAGASAVFFARAFLFSSWVSRGPEVQAALDINTAQMGLLSMLYPAGGLAGVLFASWLVSRLGSRTVNTGTYLLAAIGLATLGPVIESGNFALASVCLFLMGLPMAISDYLGNYEGAAVDKASKRSLFPAIHGSFGVGMLLGAAVASWFIDQGVSVATSFLIIAIVVAVISISAGFGFPAHSTPITSSASKSNDQKNSLKVWTEKRSLLLAVVGFSFIMAESSAGTWVPIALTANGFGGAAAASALGLFWIVITLARLGGGYLVDLLGRYRTVLVSALTTAAGMLVFMTSEATGLEYLGLILWGLGMSLGFPMVVASMGDDPDLAAPRVNMIITVVYISSISVGPALGALGQAAGIYVAFGIPLVMMVVSALLSRVTKPLSVN
jgi:fucose permease